MLEECHFFALLARFRLHRLLPALFVDPEKKALDLAANTLQAEQQQVTTNTLQVSEQQVNASDTGTHMPAKALFKALEFGNPSAIGMVNINDTFVNGSSALVQAEADGGNQSAKAFWRALEFGPPNGESIGNTTYMNGTVVAAKLDATVLQEAEQQTQGRTAGPANVSDKAFWRDIEFGKASESSIGIAASRWDHLHALSPVQMAPHR